MELLPSARVRRWRESKGLSVRMAAAAIGCSASAVSLIEAGKRSAGLTVAFQIEAATADWDEGPIAATEWVPS